MLCLFELYFLFIFCPVACVFSSVILFLLLLRESDVCILYSNTVLCSVALQAQMLRFQSVLQVASNQQESKNCELTHNFRNRLDSQNSLTPVGHTSLYYHTQ